MAHFSPRLIRMTASALLGGLALCALASPASAAWTADCLWNGIPAADRAAAIAAMSQEGASPFRLAPAKIEAAFAACGVTAGDSADAQKAFAAYGSGLAAMAGLRSRHGVTQAQLLGAWAALPSRAGVVGIARTMRNEPQKVALLETAASQMGQSLNLGSEAAPDLRQVVYSLAMLQSLGHGGIDQ